MARALGARGAAVGLVARSDEALQATAAELERLGGRDLWAPADVAEWEHVQTAARAVEETLGPVDLFAPRAARVVASTFAALTISDVLQLAYRELIDAADAGEEA